MLTVPRYRVELGRAYDSLSRNLDREMQMVNDLRYRSLADFMKDIFFSFLDSFECIFDIVIIQYIDHICTPLSCVCDTSER